MARARLLLVALLVAALPAARAGASGFFEGEDSGNPSILSVNRSLSLGYLSTHLYYLEPSVGTTNGYLDYERGDQKGGRVAATYMTRERHVYLHVQWSGAEGRVGYTGYFLTTPPTPATGFSRATTQDAFLKGGQGFAVGDHLMLTPYVGVGWRNWVRELGLGTPGDYNESYSFYFGTVGGMIQVSPIDRLVIGLDGGIGRTFGAAINVPDFGLDQAPLGSKPIVTAGADIDCRVLSFLHVFASLDYTHFQFGQSLVYPPFGLEEPYSKTTLYEGVAGIRIPLWMEDGSL